MALKIMLCITSSIVFVSKFNIVHGDVGMKMFVISLDFFKDEIFGWYAKFCRKKITSFSYFSKAFLKYWLPLHKKNKYEGLRLHMVE